MNFNISHINYPTPNSILGEMSEMEYQIYRTKFRDQLRARYPSAEINVTSLDGPVEIIMSDDTDPSDAIDDVHWFANYCWENQ